MIAISVPPCKYKGFTGLIRRSTRKNASPHGFTGLGGVGGVIPGGRRVFSLSAGLGNLEFLWSLVLGAWCFGESISRGFLRSGDGLFLWLLLDLPGSLDFSL